MILNVAHNRKDRQAHLNEIQRFIKTKRNSLDILEDYFPKTQVSGTANYLGQMSDRMTI